MTPRHRSSAAPLAWTMVALVLYASLYPFTGWRWPVGNTALGLMQLPWPPWLTPLDEALNFVGYLPLGLLAAVAALRTGRSALTALAGTVVLASLLSYGCELLQHLLPGRHPSLKDWLMNTLGAMAGALLGLLLSSTGALERWHRMRQRWFARQAAGALALLALWPLGLLFPTPVPWGLGAVGEPLRETLLEWLTGVDWAGGLSDLLQPSPAPPRLGPLAERLAAATGLLSPVLVAYGVTRPGLPRAVLGAGALLLGYLTMAVSALLNYGPAHVLSWLTPAAAVGSVAAAVAGLLLLPVSPRVAQGLALLVLGVGLSLVAQAPSDPYFAQNVQAWEQGRFVRFHGLAQWVGWGWPFLAIAWLVARLARREGASG
ncbi:MAG: VanZ family protein [Rubrivivax sp.]|nr:VanZ family protein [Rubrivivax sp.]